MVSTQTRAATQNDQRPSEQQIECKDGTEISFPRIGVPARTIQAILRHSNFSTTLAFYVKTAPADAHAAMARLEPELGNEWATAKGTQVN